MNIPDEIIESVKGFLDREEGLRLHRLAKEASRYAPCLEIGSYCGRSTLYLGDACRENGSILFSIDHHRGSEEQQPGEEYFDPETYDMNAFGVNTFPLFRKTIAMSGLEDTVVPIVSTSTVTARMWTIRLGLVFIDGGHSYETACSDYNNWIGHIVPGGYLLIHDIFKNPDEGGQAPYEVYRLAISSGLFVEMPMTGTLGVLKRRPCGSIAEAGKGF